MRFYEVSVTLDDLEAWLVFQPFLRFYLYIALVFRRETTPMFQPFLRFYLGGDGRQDSGISLLAAILLEILPLVLGGFLGF